MFLAGILIFSKEEKNKFVFYSFSSSQDTHMWFRWYQLKVCMKLWFRTKRWGKGIHLLEEIVAETSWFWSQWLWWQVPGSSLPDWGTANVRLWQWGSGMGSQGGSFWLQQLLHCCRVSSSISWPFLLCVSGHLTDP